MSFIFSTIVPFRAFAKILMFFALFLPAEAAPKKEIKKKTSANKPLLKKAGLKKTVLKKSEPVKSTLLQQLDQYPLSANEKKTALTLKKWYKATLSPTELNAATLEQRLEFIKNHGNYPQISKIKKLAEEQLLLSGTQHQLIAFLKENAPQTLKGKFYYASHVALDRQEYIVSLWFNDESLSASDLSELYLKFPDVLKKQFRDKMDQLLSLQEYKKAKALASLCAQSLTPLEQRRLSMLEAPSSVSYQEIAALLKNEFDPGLLLTFLQTFRKQSEDLNNTQTLHAVFNAHQEKIKQHEERNPQSWWLERHILSRRLLEHKDYQQAADLLDVPFVKDKETYFHAKWMKAWLYIKFLNKPAEGREILFPLFEKAQTPVTKARMAYWLYKSYGQKDQESTEWLLKAQSYPFTFYGQKALSKGISFLPASAHHKAALKNHEFVNCIELLSKIRQTGFLEVFLISLCEQAKTPEDQEYIIHLAHQFDRSNLVLKVSKKTTLAKLPRSSYPTPYAVHKKSSHELDFKALCYAIMRQESRFDPKALSPAGAKGLMQLMEPTAQATAKKWNTKVKNLFQPENNIELGSAHVHDLLDYYQGDWVLVVAAYNAGKKAVDSWIEKYGDPRKLKHHEDFIELIPYGETRNYVQRVGENYYVYEWLFNSAS